jgi:hypothetical protein
MNKIYESQEDGSLKLLDQPECIVKKLALYKWLQEQGLTLEEIRFLAGDSLPCG